LSIAFIPSQWEFNHNLTFAASAFAVIQVTRLRCGSASIFTLAAVRRIPKQRNFKPGPFRRAEALYATCRWPGTPISRLLAAALTK